jgi:hypothetical protein
VKRLRGFYSKSAGLLRFLSVIALRVSVEIVIRNRALPLCIYLNPPAMRSLKP